MYLTVVGSLFQLVPAMGTSSWRELTKFLTSHLLNTQLTWPLWTQWGEDYVNAIELECFGDQKTFLDLLVNQLTRGSLPDRVMASIPESLHVAVPRDTSIEPRCLMFDFVQNRTGELTSMQVVAGDLLVRIADKNHPNVLLQWLEGPHVGIDDMFQSESWRGILLISGILVSGATKGNGTLSSVMSLIDRYRDPLRELAAASDNSEQVIHYNKLCNSYLKML